MIETIYSDMRQGISPGEIARAGDILKKGGLVAFPTETVYGLGGDALNPEASAKIYAAKGRPSDNPLIVHIADLSALPVIAGAVPEAARKLAGAFWPGPLTMILPKTDLVPRATTGGLDTVAVRFPSHPVAQALIRAAGGFVAAPSANTSGRPSPTRADHVREDLGGKIDMIIDGGEVGIGLESSIVDLTEDRPVILRPGFVNQEMLREVIGSVDLDRALMAPDGSLRPKAPGMKYRHYAPKAQMVIVTGSRAQVQKTICRLAEEAALRGERPAILCAAETAGGYPAQYVKTVGAWAQEETIAQNLYACLREFDESGATVIFSEAFDTPRMGQAIMNRLQKAAGGRIICAAKERSGKHASI